MKSVFEKIIEKLEDRQYENRHTLHHDEWNVGIDQAIEIVNKMDEEYNNGWIPCSERLPNKEEFLKAYIRNKYGAEFIVMIEGANRPTTLYLTSDGLWVDDCRNVHEVIAWKPLPEPYHPKGE